MGWEEYRLCALTWIQTYSSVHGRVFDHPGVQLSQHRHAGSLACQQARLGGAVLVLTLDAV